MVEKSSGSGGSKTVSRITIVRWLVREYLGVAFVGVFLFWSAGTIDWIMGWSLVAITFAWVSANAILLIPSNPQLLAERLGRIEGAKSWDKMILSIIAVSTIARLVVAGLDHRYGWSTGIGSSAQIAAAVVAALGYAIVVWATVSNAFFSQIVRIQSDRGHQVVSTGPYSFVRHPGYVGTVLFELGVPIMLGSHWALLIGLLIAVLFIIRTALEDKTLHDELGGYPEYAQQVRYRLLPRVW